MLGHGSQKVFQKICALRLSPALECEGLGPAAGPASLMNSNGLAAWFLIVAEVQGFSFHIEKARMYIS